MTNPKTDLAEIFTRHLEHYESRYAGDYDQRRAAWHIMDCRTAALGGHAGLCNACGHVQVHYNSCRDRHCPKCQTLTKERWLEKRKAELLPVHYFHVVFTLPHEINPLAAYHAKTVYDMLFRSASDTLKQFAKDRLKEEIGFMAILHTWDQKLNRHIHIHCIVPAVCLNKKRYLFPVKALSLVFRGKFMEDLKKSFRQGLLTSDGQMELIKSLWAKKWVVYAKPPFQKPEDVLEYLGRYTHRVAISNNRIISLKDGKVTIAYRNRKAGTNETLSLDAVEFIRRFMQHILPSGFMKIRSYGFLANRYKKQKIGQLREKLGLNPVVPEKAPRTIPEMMMDLTGKDITLCPVCGKGTLVPMAEFPNTRKTGKHRTAFAFG